MGCAERAAGEVVRCVQPTEESERRRAGVVDYARRLVGASLGCEVFPFGSVPLKTYLPDGDVDLTVLGNTSYNSTLINDVRCILESEEQNGDAEFEVKGVQYINAEVRLIKCVIENIIVDISFNQTGGMCTLCFLELIDRQVGKNHLFKRSIILIKAWCHHESRILGAHHGLISTYALETLVLYIFNLFHKSLHGPLEVLYKFLEYFSKFDWDSHCISLNGPVALSSFPNVTVEATYVHGDDLLFGKEFLNSPVGKLLVAPASSEGCYAKFRPKHLNIIDPLRGNNNLGRSVSRASFYRIRSAFSFGAQKLGRILMLPSEFIPDEIYEFFTNTLERHGKGERPDFGNNVAFLGPGKTLREDISSMKISYMKEDENRSPHLSPVSADKDSHVKINGRQNSARSLPGDAQDHTWNKMQRRKFTSKDQNVSGAGAKSSQSIHYAPRHDTSFRQENGNGNTKGYPMNYATEAAVHRTAKAFHAGTRSSMQPQIYPNNPSHVLTSSTRSNTLEVSNYGLTDKSTWIDLHAEKSRLPPFSPSSLPDLSGDLDLHLTCLRQVQYHLEYLFDGLLQSVQEACSANILDNDFFTIPTLSVLLNTDATVPALSSASSTDTDGRNSSPVSCSHSTGDVSQQSQDDDQWGAACQQSISLPTGTDVPSNGLSSPSTSAAADWESISWYHSSENIPRVHGTGTYIPKVNYDTYKRMASEKARKLKLPDHHWKTQNNPQGNLYRYKNSRKIWNFGPNKEHVTAEVTTHQLQIKQNTAHKDVYPNKGLVPTGDFVPYKEGVAPDSGPKQMQVNQPWKVQNNPHVYVCSNKNMIGKQSCDANRELVPDCGATQVPMHQPLKVHNSLHADVCSNKNSNEKGSCDTHKEFVPPSSRTKQIQSFEPSELQNSVEGIVYSSNYIIQNQRYDNHREHPTFGRAATLNVQNSLTEEVNSNRNLIEKGSQLTPFSPKVPFSHYGGNGQEQLPASNGCQPSFSIAKGYSQTKGSVTERESLEFGSLGPVSLGLFSSKLSKASNALFTSKVSAQASAATKQSPRTSTTQSRPPGFYQLRDEDDFPPLQAGNR